MLSTKIAGNYFQNCIYNASGAMCQTGHELNKLDLSQSGCIITKTCTFKKRLGNDLPRYFANKDLSIQSMGLPNEGFKFYLDYASKVKKPYILSISPRNMNYFKEILCAANDIAHIIMYEVNVSCPNIQGESQIGYDMDKLEEVLKILFENSRKPFGIKLPPYFESYFFQQVSKLILKYHIKFITCINSIGNGLYIDIETESTVIKPKNGLGGLGGKAIKSIGLSNVYQFYQILKNNDVDIIGCGGVEHGSDVFEYILAGASAVQIGSTLVEEGPECFSRISKELICLMNLKRYRKIKDFKGKIKII